MKLLSIALFSALLASCNSAGNSTDEHSAPADSSKTTAVQTPSAPAAQKLGIFTVEGDSLLVPPFGIEISLSPAAEQKIVGGKETIVVSVMLDGTPTDPANASIAEDGTFYVGGAEQEISYGQVARFNNLRIAKSIYDQLSDKDPNLTVNVYTGRKSSPNNLITGDFLSGKISTLVNKNHKLNYKLIYGDE